MDDSRPGAQRAPAGTPAASGIAAVTSDVEVYVATGTRSLLVGRLDSGRRDPGEPASFGYDDQYLADADAYAVDPLLPLVAGPLRAAAGRALFGAFADSTPDRWGRMLVRRTEQARADAAGTDPRSLAELDLLLGVRDDLRQGALRYRLDEHSPFASAEDSGAPVLADLPVLLDLATRAERGTAGYQDLQRLTRSASSLGGARPKAHVLNAAGRVAIAKFPNLDGDGWNVMAWEKVALDLARAAGLTVADSQLIRVAGRHVLIVERFDRHDGARIGYASAMTMLQAGDREQRSYLEIAAVIEKHSPAATAELRQLWRRMVYSVLISNTDDHLRNHAFLHVPAGSWSLSPAFDLNPNPRPGPKNLSTAIDSTDTRASVDTLLSVAGHFRLDPGAALELLAEVTHAVASWRHLAASHGLAQADIDAMEPAFEHAEAQRARTLAP